MRLRLAGVAVTILAMLSVAISSTWEYLQSRGEILPIAESAVVLVPLVDSAVRMGGLMWYGQRAVVFVLSFLLVAVVGYWLARRTNVRADPVTVLAAFFLAGIAGFLLGWMGLGLVIEGGLGSLGRVSPLGWVIQIIGPTVAAGIHYALVGFAGVAIAEFNVLSRLRVRLLPTVHDTETNAPQ